MEESVKPRRMSFKTDSNKEAIIFACSFTALLTLAVIGVEKILIIPDTPIDPAYDNTDYAHCMSVYYEDISIIKSKQFDSMYKQENIVNFGRTCAKIVGIDKPLELDFEQQAFNLGFTEKDHISKSCYHDTKGSSWCYGPEWVEKTKKFYGVQ